MTARKSADPQATLDPEALVQSLGFSAQCDPQVTLDLALLHVARAINNHRAKRMTPRPPTLDDAARVAGELSRRFANQASVTLTVREGRELIELLEQLSVKAPKRRGRPTGKRGWEVTVRDLFIAHGYAQCRDKSYDNSLGGLRRILDTKPSRGEHGRNVALVANAFGVDDKTVNRALRRIMDGALAPRN